MVATTVRSIYAHIDSPIGARSQHSRQAQRHRAQARLRVASPESRAIDIDRLNPMYRLLQIYRDAKPETIGVPSPLEARVLVVESELIPLEKWARKRSTAVQTQGRTIRQALEFLKIFGRITALDFSVIPVEERAQLVRLLMLEHRWCYAAAGTTRECFKNATGRTGAR